MSRPSILLLKHLRLGVARLRGARPLFRHAQAGHSLVELLTVLSLLGLCFAVGAVSLSQGLASVEARGAAQDWQSAAAWAQTAAVWQGTAQDLLFDSERLEVSSNTQTESGDLGDAAPSVPTIANVVRWRVDQGVVVRFVAGTASPNASGALYFKAPGDDYRVTVRLESGLTVRTRAEGAP
jgi:Tfp pilus assembly protein FimT